MIPRYKVQLVRENTVCYEELPAVTKPEDAVAVLKDYFAPLDREHLVVLMLDTSKKPIGINTVCIGTLGECSLHPREVFKPAILANADSIILAHNHPSGDTAPSECDYITTKELEEAGQMIGIPVIDDLIIADGKWESVDTSSEAAQEIYRSLMYDRPF